MTLITEAAELAAFCERLAGAELIAVDTEFMRERTYWPKLCLVQVAGPEEAAAIDPLADGIDLAPLFDAAARARDAEGFHAARQDLEIFHRLMGGELPQPVFDTQVAAMVCGFGDQVSYETLVGKLAKARIDKSSRFTDWSLRPLSPRQIDYAIADVVHLVPVYRKLAARLRSSGRGRLAGGGDGGADRSRRTTRPIRCRPIRRVKSRSGNGRMLAVLRELAAWRERDAQTRDVPRAWVLRDEALLEIAHHTPKTVDDLARTRGLARKFAESGAGEAVLAAVARGLAVPEAEWPETDLRREVPRGVGGRRRPAQGAAEDEVRGGGRGAAAGRLVRGGGVDRRARRGRRRAGAARLAPSGLRRGRAEDTRRRLGARAARQKAGAGEGGRLLGAHARLGRAREPVPSLASAASRSSAAAPGKNCRAVIVSTAGPDPIPPSQWAEMPWISER